MRMLVLLAAFSVPFAATHAQSGVPTEVKPPIYFDFQVEKQAAMVPGTISLKYPEAHKTAKVVGEVLAQFVVDTSGFADTTSFKILKATDVLFAQAVRDALPTMRFVPAYVGDRKVKQLVQLPFAFSIK